MTSHGCGLCKKDRGTLQTADHGQGPSPARKDPVILSYFCGSGFWDT